MEHQSACGANGYLITTNLQEHKDEYTIYSPTNYNFLGKKNLQFIDSQQF